MNKQRLLTRMDLAWRDLRASYEGLSEAEITRAGVDGPWSVRDLIAHVTIWEEEALQHLPEIVAGRRPARYSTTYGGIDAFNAASMAARADATLAKVLRQAEETHERLVAYVQATLPEADVEPRFLRRLRQDSYEHYSLHARAIRDWRSGLAVETAEGNPT